MDNLNSILAYKIKTYLASISIKTKFHYDRFIDKWIINVQSPNNSEIWYSWASFENFLLSNNSVFGNNEFKNLIPYSDYLISDSFEELSIKLTLIGC
jgi:hypothetical protein